MRRPITLAHAMKSLAWCDKNRNSKKMLALPSKHIASLTSSLLHLIVFPSSSQPMLDLPELLDKVFQHLGRHDLTRCAQVNKQWHALTIPYIWRELTCKRLDDLRRDTFRRIVLEDYLQENGDEERPLQLSTLSKYGHLIRLLPELMDLKNNLRPHACTQQGNEPTAHDLVLHLFKHSTKAQVKFLHYIFMDPESDSMKSILEFILPRLRDLHIQTSIRTQSEFFKFKSLLDQCSTTLESLSVIINIQQAVETVDMQDEATEDESICWTSLKDLTLRHFPDDWDAGSLWSWMWKRCGQVERLHVQKIDASTPSLVRAMFAKMQNLQRITIGDHNVAYLEDKMEDDVVAELLSGSRHGWKSVSVRSTVKLGRETMNALTLHYSTLEELNVDGSNNQPSCDLVQVLRSCPHLHTLTYTDMYDGSSMVSGEAFIDLDPDTGLLKPWLCEGSLKILQVVIAGIPRPDLENENVVAEVYPGQGREIQGQVYDRLGRLTHLEKLKICDPSCISYQYDCLEMSLESGLEKLSGLKSLKELSIVNLVTTKIGIKEVQWMVENWPKLNTIYGLDGRGRDVEAVEWLRVNEPKIEVQEEEQFTLV